MCQFMCNACLLQMRRSNNNNNNQKWNHNIKHKIIQKLYFNREVLTKCMKVNNKLLKRKFSNCWIYCNSPYITCICIVCFASFQFSIVLIILCVHTAYMLFVDEILDWMDWSKTILDYKLIKSDCIQRTKATNKK